MVVVGFNHNFRYRGEIFHVQTEDSGRKNPFVVTLLYKGGTILASKKTSYADILKIDHLERVVEELMKDQHREMLRRLKNGDFDPTIQALFFSKGTPAAGEKAAAPVPKPAPAATPAAGPSVPPAPVPPSPPAEKPASAHPPQTPPRRDKVVEASLDEIILSYLAGEDPEEEDR